jgi:hypothetical protein
MAAYVLGRGHMGTSVVSYWEKPSPLQPCLAVAAFCRMKSRAPVTPAGFSIGSLGRNKPDIFNGEGPINCLFSRSNGRLLAMRLTRHDCAADECGPFPHMPPDAFDDPVLDASIFHIGRTARVFSPLARIYVRNERGANDADWRQIGRGYNVLFGYRN